MNLFWICGARFPRLQKLRGDAFSHLFSLFAPFFVLFCAILAPFWCRFGGLFGPIFGPILDAFWVGMVPKICRNEFKFVSNLVPEMVHFGCHFGCHFGRILGVVSDVIGKQLGAILGQHKIPLKCRIHLQVDIYNELAEFEPKFGNA